MALVAVDAHAALDAAPDLLAEKAGHVLLLVQVLGVLVDVGEAVDLVAGEMGRRGQEVLVLRLLRLVEGRPDNVDAVHLKFAVAVDQFAVEIDVPPHLR